MRNLIFILFITFSFVSCNLFEEKIEENAIARVQNKILFDSELKEVIPFDASTEDSLLIANNYIQKWIKQNLILEKAELNLTADIINIDLNTKDLTILMENKSDSIVLKK